MPETSLTQKLIRDGLAPKRHMTDAQAVAERCELAAQAGRAVVERRRVLLEAASFIRAAYELPAKSEGRAA